MGAEEQHAEQPMNKILLSVISVLSMFGSLAIIVTYFLFRDLQSTSRRILVYISIGDFFTVYPTFVFTLHYHDSGSDKDIHSVNCTVQSFVTSMAVMWSFLWTSFLAIYLYLVVVKKQKEQAERSMVYFHIINWGVPFVLVLAAACVHYLGRTDAKTTGGWCWIATKNHPHWEAILWMLACGKLFEVASYLVNVILYYIVTKKIKEEVKGQRHSFSEESTQAAEQGRRKLILAPVLYVLLRVWGTIRFLLFCSGHTHDYAILLALHIIGDNSQGLVYFILFCVLTVKFRKNVSRMCCAGKTSIQEEKSSLITTTGKNESPDGYIIKHPRLVTLYS